MILPTAAVSPMNTYDRSHFTAPRKVLTSSTDGPRARRFYQDLFGWPSNVLDANHGLVGDDGLVSR
jgi:hypothetical protein